MHAWKLFGIVAPFVLITDLVWLGVVMKGFYARELGELMRRSADGLAPRWSAALLVYVLIPAGIVLFVRPHLGEGATAPQALAWGAAFGLALYGVYDLTNLAILDKWTLRMTLVDILWGMCLCASGSFVLLVAERWLRR